MDRALRLLVCLCVGILLVAGSAFGQGSQSGAISGSVKDSTGAVISGATITIVNEATKNVERTVVTTGDGLFTASLLPPGDYTIKVQAPGFSPFSSSVEVQLNGTTRVDARLAVGTVTETRS